MFLIQIVGMIRGGFLTDDELAKLLALDRSGTLTGVHRKRPNAIILLHRGQSCETVAKNLLLDDDTVRTWHKIYTEGGVDALCSTNYKGSECRLTSVEQDSLRSWVKETLPSTTGEIGQWIEDNFDVTYSSRSGLIELLHRLDLVYKKPEIIPRKLDAQAQENFIRKYESLLNSLNYDETVVFADAVHPTHMAKRAGFWCARDEKPALCQNSGRNRLNIHGSIDLETGQTCMIDVEKVDAQSAIALLSAIEKRYPNKKCIHVFWDNAKYHHAILVRKWLARSGCRIKLHFVPAYCPHLVPIERLWGVMHKNITHNRCYKTFGEFCNAILTFLKETIPKNWTEYCDSVSDNFRVINPDDFRLIR